MRYVEMDTMSEEDEFEGGCPDCWQEFFAIKSARPVASLDDLLDGWRRVERYYAAEVADVAELEGCAANVQVFVAHEPGWVRVCESGRWYQLEDEAAGPFRARLDRIGRMFSDGAARALRLRPHGPAPDQTCAALRRRRASAGSEAGRGGGAAATPDIAMRLMLCLVG